MSIKTTQNQLEKTLKTLCSDIHKEAHIIGSDKLRALSSLVNAYVALLKLSKQTELDASALKQKYGNTDRYREIPR